jgi:hypothetical protein
MRRLAALFSAGLLAACSVAPSLALRREALARQIADDAAAFNDAYGRAVTGQILLNILRSRDRLPRYYLSMTGIQDSPQARWAQSVGIGSIPVGDDLSPRGGFGSLGVQRETLSRPSYAVQPFEREVLSRTAFEPIQPYIFAHYWRGGWPRDLLVLLMVERIARTGPDRRETELVNEANVIFEDCAPQVDTSGCAFVREVRALLREIERQSETRASADAAPVCGLLAAYATARPARPLPGPENARCDPRLIVGDTVYALSLRSLDDIVYYVGELMRAGSMSPDAEVIEAQVKIAAAGLRGGGAGVPLFRLVRETAAEREARGAPRRRYAASVASVGAG